MSTAALATLAPQNAGTYVRDHDAIVEAMNRYTEGVRTGNSAAMKPSFHELCTFYGYFDGQLLVGPIQMLFDWVDGNGPSRNLDARFASVDILDTIASVRLEVENVTGTSAGELGSRFSDLFQLIKIEGRWLISQKSFHGVKP
jgi:putative lumazine-binding protein